MSTRPSFMSQTSQTRRREPSFPSFQSRGSSTAVPTVGSPAAAAGAWGAPAPPSDPAITQQQAQRKKGPSLSLALSPGESDRAAGTESIHPLKYTWDVWFSHRSAGANGGKNGKKEEAVKTGKEKESREEWEGGVVKLGGFSSIESMHPFMAHLTPPSALPSSIASSAQLFNSSANEFPPSTNNITDYNVFRSPIAPAWEDPANTGGGRWVLRLRKGVADRVWEEVVFALVGERIGGDDDRVENKVNGVVLSVRKDEDILSLWCAPSSRAERDIIRDALRTALEPLLTATSAANLILDYKPHPAPAGSNTGHAANRSDLPGRGGDHNHSRTESPHRHHREHTRERSNNTDTSSTGGERQRTSTRTGGFSSYNSSRAGADSRDRSSEAFGGVGSIGTGSGGFGRSRRGSLSKTEGESRAPTSSWGRV